MTEVSRRLRPRSELRGAAGRGRGPTSTPSRTSRGTSRRTAAASGRVRPSAHALHQRHRRDRRPPAPVGDAARARRLGADLRPPAGPRRGHRRAAPARRSCRLTSGDRSTSSASRRGRRRSSASRTTTIDLGIPGRIFPQWLRCTGCNLLAPVSDESLRLPQHEPVPAGPGAVRPREVPGLVG